MNHYRKLSDELNEIDHFDAQFIAMCGLFGDGVDLRIDLQKMRIDFMKNYLGILFRPIKDDTPPIIYPDDTRKKLFHEDIANQIQYAREDICFLFSAGLLIDNDILREKKIITETVSQSLTCTTKQQIAALKLCYNVSQYCN